MAGCRTARARLGPAEAAIDSAPGDTPSLFAALREQPRLELKAARGPVEILVVDRAERPGAN